MIEPEAFTPRALIGDKLRSGRNPGEQIVEQDHIQRRSETDSRHHVRTDMMRQRAIEIDRFEH